MVASRIAPRMIAARASSEHDHRLVAASALAAVAVLFLMLLAGTATAEDAVAQCQDRSCSVVAATHSDGAAPYFPASTRYTTVKLVRATPAQ